MSLFCYWSTDCSYIVLITINCGQIILLIINNVVIKSVPSVILGTAIVYWYFILLN